MGETTTLAAEPDKQLALPFDTAERLVAYARARGVPEEEVVRRALELLFRQDQPEASDTDDLPELAAPPDLDVEVPIVFELRPKAVHRVEAQVVSTRRGNFELVCDDVLLEPDAE